MLKLAILDADILYEPLQALYHSYGQMFVNLLRRANADWDITIYSVINGEYPASPDDHDAYLVTGSKYDSFADDDWIVQLRQYTQMLYAEAKPVVGICFGHQLLAHALGGEAARSDAGWGLGVMAYDLCEHAAFTEGEGPINLIISHQDQVRSLPAQARLLLSNDFCPYAGFYIPDKVLAIQGHPEFTTDYAKALLACRVDQLPLELIESTLLTFSTPHHGTRVASWIVRFVETAVSVGADRPVSSGQAAL